MRRRALATGSDAARDRQRRSFASQWELSAACRLVEPSARGGTAEVWHAVGDGGREAALKTPESSRRGGTRALNALIQREYDVLRAVAGRHIVEAYELVEHDAVPALVMEYLPHGDLVPLLGARPTHWLPAFRAIVMALIEVHRQGFAHGDVKARNVLFAADGTRAPRRSSPRPARSSPRPPLPRRRMAFPRRLQAAGRERDCFALAVLLYELSTGRLPYGATGPAERRRPPGRSALRPTRGAWWPRRSQCCAPQAAVGSPAYLLDVIESAYDVAG